MTILLTGARGNLGRVLLPMLRGEGHVVIPCDRNDEMGTGVSWDLDIHAAPVGQVDEVDCVIHAAARIGGFGMSASDGNLLAHTNVMGAWKVAEWCTAANVAHLIQVSSAIVYGQWDQCPKKETDPVDPWSAGLYAATKYLAEIAAERYARAGGRLSILRLGSMYGEDMRTGLPYTLLRKAITDGSMFELFGSTIT